jgi:hypothetical protein
MISRSGALGTIEFSLVGVRAQRTKPDRLKSVLSA